MKRAILAALAVVVVSGATGCDDKKAAAGAAPEAKSLAPSTTSAASKTVKFTIDPKSSTSIDMPAPKEHIKAGTDVASGTVDVDLMNVANTRGEVKVDLLSLSTTTFGDAAKDKTQTNHARTWLEVADGEDGKLPDDVKTANRYALFAIRSVDNLSAVDVTKVAPTKDGADDVRTITATAHGELLVHQHKVERDADVEVQFRYAPGATPDKPRSITIKSKKPLRATLADHEVKPRDGFGKIAKQAFNLLGTKVADVADITLDLRANAAP